MSQLEVKMWGIELCRNSGLPLARQIYQTLRDAMAEGRLQPGEPLPSTREMAKQLAISRNTACEAYEMLFAEGYIVSRQGSPTRVAEGLYLGKPAPAPEEPVETELPEGGFLADFRTGQPDLRRIPRHTWLNMLHKAAEEFTAEQWSYTGPEGLPALRREIAAWLFRSRGIAAAPHDIFITAGTTQALHLLADILPGKDREIIMEDPCHSVLLSALEEKGYRIRPVAVDEQGMQTWRLGESGAGAVYVTPSHQFPLGGILPADRRAALIRFARQNGRYVIEDDYDSEFRYAGTPVAPLYCLDQQQVIYVGTFSKILFPALRIGYVILPRPLQARWRILRTYADIQNPPFEQAALAEYLRSRKLDRHIQKMRRLYGQKRKILLQTIEEVFGTGWKAWGDAAGLHLALEFPGKYFDEQFLTRCEQRNLRVTPVEQYSNVKGSHLDKLLLGYGHLEPDEIRAGIRLLHDVMPSD
jgi:GntR family transcriptional regulator / MocR family aminotransferase